MNFSLMLDGLLADDNLATVDQDRELLEAEAEALVGDCALVTQVKTLQGLEPEPEQF